MRSVLAALAPAVGALDAGGATLPSPTGAFCEAVVPGADEPLPSGGGCSALLDAPCVGELALLPTGSLTPSGARSCPEQAATNSNTATEVGKRMPLDMRAGAALITALFTTRTVDGFFYAVPLPPMNSSRYGTREPRALVTQPAATSQSPILTKPGAAGLPALAFNSAKFVANSVSWL